MTSPLTTAARALVLAQSGVDCFDDIESEAQKSAREHVRAVLDSIVRNASETMLRAGANAGNWSLDFDLRECEAEAAAVLQAMIDAALSE